MVTGKFDSASIAKSGELSEECDNQGAGETEIQACHIFNESTMQGIVGEDAVENKVRGTIVSQVPHVSATHTYLWDKHAANAMAILKNFGLESLADELLVADGVHNLGNLLSLSPEMHIFFDRLTLWFEATDEVCH